MMLLAVLALTVSAQGTPPPRQQQTVVRDSTARDSTKRNAPIRKAVTPALLASAFHDVTARDLLTRARAARIAQDSSLSSYDAKVWQRLSVKAAIGSIPLEHLAYRGESVARVQWQRGVGARVEVTGARVAIPMVGIPEAEKSALEGMVRDASTVPIPYFPGHEPMWVGGFIASAEVNEGDIVNPLADGAVAYYTYRSSDSLTIRLNDGRAITLRQVEVRPRYPAFNLVVGSMWFDQASGQLVRAAYRLSGPAGAGISVSDTSGKEHKVVQGILKAIMPSMSAQITSVVVEYELYDGFWLPKMQTMEGIVKASVARVPVTFENSFAYATVNTSLGLTAIHVDSIDVDDPPRPKAPAGLDTSARRKWNDSVSSARTALMKARADSTKAGMRVGTMRQCDTSAVRVLTSNQVDGRVPTELKIPCDLDKLARSPDLTKSIFDDGEAVYGSTERERLIGDALSMAAQSPLVLSALFAPQFQFGLSMSRFNRIEGFSTGLRGSSQLGAGFDVIGTFRVGSADRVPNAELSLGRSNFSKTIRLTGYRRLVSASDWGQPLGFGSSLSALLYGRDDGFYYRATGGDLTWTSDRGLRLDWRAFSEAERSATQRTNFSIGGSFVPNIVAKSDWYSGASVRFQHSVGLDPRGFRFTNDLRFEGGIADSAYGRGALDLTLSHPLVGPLEASLTAAGGSSVGALPPQRRWYLGSNQTIRGIRPDSGLSGNAFWFGRGEIGYAQGFMRTAVFTDIGWVGDRTKMRRIGRPLSSVGVGFSFLDGALRFDVAHTLYPYERTRLAFYLGSRF